MNRLIRLATALFLFCRVHILFEAPAQGAPGDFLYQWGANVNFSAPHATAVDQSGNVYVTDMSGSVQVFDKTDKRIRVWGTYGSGDGQLAYPAGITVGSGGTVYVVETHNNRVQAFTAAGTYQRKWGSLGTGDGEFNAPNAIASDSAGNLYVSDGANNRIQVFDSTGRFLRKWGTSGSGDGQLYYPAAIAVDATGNVYVADSGNYRIVVFDKFGRFLRKWGNKGEGSGQFMAPSALALDADGHVFVADYILNSVLLFDTVGNYIGKWGSPPQESDLLAGISGMAIQGNTQAYVVGTKNAGVAIFSREGRFLRKWWSFGSGDGELNSPMGPAVESDGNVYVADTANERIQVFTAAGSFLRKWGGGVFSQYPFGVALSSTEDVYVVDPFTSSIKAYDQFGTYLRQWNAGVLGEALGVAISPSDTLYVASGGIQAFDLYGNQLASWLAPHINFVANLATDSKGRIFASDSGNVRVAVFDPQGRLLRTIGEGYFAFGPGAIAVDVNGNVFVAGGDDISTRISVFDANGALRAKWCAPKDDPGLFSRITGIALNRGGTRIYVTDGDNNRVVVLEGFGNRIPNGWLTRDIGSVGVAGGAGYLAGTFTISGSGADIWGATDAFRYVYQPLTGDGQIVARVASLQNTNGYAKSGVMIRESLTANSRNAMMVVTPSYGAKFSRRSVTGGSTAVTGLSGIAPYWVKLVRQGNTFSGYVSSNGATWSLVGTSTITMGSSVHVGLVVSSHNNSVLSSSVIDNVSVIGKVNLPTVAITAPAEGTSYYAPASIELSATATAASGAMVRQVDFFAGSTLIGTATASPYRVNWSNAAAGEYTLTARVTDTRDGMVTSIPVKVRVVQSPLPPPWQTADVGSVGLAGSASYLNGVFTLRGSGADIWGSSDAFRFVYKPMTGDGEIVARVVSLQNTHSFAKSGVMMRDSLAANSMHAMMNITPGYRADFSRRTATGGATVATGRGVAAPYWVKLVRRGNTFSGYISSNGTTWSPVGSSTISMKGTIYVGLVVTSHNDSTLCSTTMTGVR